MKLTDVCGIQMGYTLRGRVEPVASGGVRVIQMGDFSSDGRIEPDALACLPLEKNVDRYLVGAGDVLFRSRGERNTATALDDEFGEPALAASPLIVLRPKKRKIEPAYLAWALNQRRAQGHFDSWARGTRLRMVPKASLDELEIDLPDLATQRLIVEVERLATRERHLVEVATEKRKALLDVLLARRAGQQLTRNKIKGRVAS
tara:strand:- start:3331 stop:3939 length:609 start_codon:yes stop_codon:yes gene_type:complete